MPTVADMAHIIGQSQGGPRGDAALPANERDQYENIVLLCRNCHGLVDEMRLTGRYTVELMRRWKERIEERVRNAVGVPRFEERQELTARVDALLRVNRGIWRNYGPESSFADDPFSDAPDTWRRLVRSEVLPNSREILRLIDANAHLLTREELEVVEDFRAHVYGFAQNHLSGERPVDVPRFPPAMNEIFGNGEPASV